VSKTAGDNNSVFKRIAEFMLRKISWAMARRKVKLAVEGVENVPCTGPVLIVARHFHHLYDGCVLMKAVPRRLHIFVALDSVRKHWIRSFLELICSLVDWPIVLRAELLNENTARDVKSVARAYAHNEATIYLRRALKDSVRLLRNGEALVVFPEAYPDIDPRNSSKVEHRASLPFRPGFAKLVEMAERHEHPSIAIVPAGLTYIQNGRWHVTLRFGPALSRSDYDDHKHLVQDVEKRVRELSDEMAGTASNFTVETIRL
jgi:putative membrane protein